MSKSDTHESPLWEYFKISGEDEGKVNCNICSKLISRGSQDKHSWGHSGPIKHLKTHAKAYTEYMKKQGVKKTEKAKAAKNEREEKARKLLNPGGRQLSLSESFVQFWDIQNPRDSRKLSSRSLSSSVSTSSPTTWSRMRGSKDSCVTWHPSLSCLAEPTSPIPSFPLFTERFVRKYTATWSPSHSFHSPATSGRRIKWKATVVWQRILSIRRLSARRSPGPVHTS